MALLPYRHLRLSNPLVFQGRPRAAQSGCDYGQDESLPTHFGGAQRRV